MKSYSPTILAILSEYTPAAFITYADSYFFPPAVISKPPIVFSMFVTSLPRKNSTPFSAAVSAIAMQSRQGFTTPALGA